MFEDREGLPHKAVVRAGILSTAVRRPDGMREGWSLARVLRHQNYTIAADGSLIASGGQRFNATPWPGGTPFDSELQHDWVVSLDDVPFAPSWIADLRDEDDLAEAVNHGGTPYRQSPAFLPSNGNRKTRRRLAALRVV